MRANEIARDGPEVDGFRAKPRSPRLAPGDPLALAQLLDLLDSPDNWTVGLAVMEIEARGCRAPPCRPAIDHVVPVETMH
jgi:hypothetical protein